MQNEKLNAREVAQALRAWAQENHLFKTEFPIDLNVDVDTKDALFDSLAISSLSESIFRNRGITAVAFNDATNEVTVFTERVVPIKEQKVLPHAIQQSVSIKYIHGGMAHAGVPTSGTTPGPYIMHNGAFACGGSIHPAKIVGAGTLGCLVRDQHGTLFGLTNNHVSGMCNYASGGEKILAPGHIDITASGIDPFTIGYHASSLPMVHGLPDNVDISTNCDAALVKISDPSLVTSMQGGAYDTPAQPFAMQPGQVVEKIGRTTGHTKGHIVGQVIGPHPVQYNVPGFGSHVSFFDPVFAIQGYGAPFSQPGDSGSLVTTELNGTRWAIGLVFAGNPQGVSFALPLQNILTTLNVTLVNNHNV